jgi:hypothetical protein
VHSSCFSQAIASTMPNTIDSSDSPDVFVFRTQSLDKLEASWSENALSRCPEPMNVPEQPPVREQPVQPSQQTL